MKPCLKSENIFAEVDIFVKTTTCLESEDIFKVFLKVNIQKAGTVMADKDTQGKASEF